MKPDFQTASNKQLQNLKTIYKAACIKVDQFRIMYIINRKYQQLRMNRLDDRIWQSSQSRSLKEQILKNIPLKFNHLHKFSVQHLLNMLLNCISYDIVNCDKIFLLFALILKLHQSVKSKSKDLSQWLYDMLQKIYIKLKQIKAIQRCDTKAFKCIMTEGWAVGAEQNIDLQIRVRLCIIITLSCLLSRHSDDVTRIYRVINQAIFMKKNQFILIPISIMNSFFFSESYSSNYKQLINQLMYHQLEFITIDKDMCQGQHHYIQQPPSYDWRFSNKTKNYLQYLQKYSKVKNIVLIVNMEHLDLMRVYPYLSDIKLVFYYGKNRYSFIMLETQFYRIPKNKKQGEDTIIEKLRQIYFRKTENITFPNFSSLNTDQHSNNSLKTILNIRVLKWITSDQVRHYEYKNIFIKFLNSQATKHRFQWNDNLSREQLIDTINNNNLSTQIIKYYTLDSPFYRIINRALRSLGHIVYLSYFKYPLITIYKQIQSLYLTKQQPIGKFYRCCKLTGAEFNYLTCNIGKFIMLEGISSFSHQPNPNFGQYCLIVYVDKHIKSEKIGGYADISKISQFKVQKQVIFNFLNYFQIIGVSQKLEQKQDELLYQEIYTVLSKFKQKQEISLYQQFHKKLLSFKQKYEKYNGQLYSIIIQKLQKYEQKQGIDNGQLYQQIHTTLQKFKQKYDKLNADIKQKIKIKLKLVIPSQLQKKQKLTNHEKSLLDIYKSQNKSYKQQIFLFRQMKMYKQQFQLSIQLYCKEFYEFYQQFKPTNLIIPKSQLLDQFQSEIVNLRKLLDKKQFEALKCLTVLQLIYQQKLQTCILYLFAKNYQYNRLLKQLLIQIRHLNKELRNHCAVQYIDCRLMQYQKQIMPQSLHRYKSINQYSKIKQNSMMELYEQTKDTYKKQSQFFINYDKCKQSHRLIFKSTIQKRQDVLEQLSTNQYKFFKEIQLFCDILLITLWEHKLNNNKQEIIGLYKKYKKHIKFLTSYRINYKIVVHSIKIIRQSYSSGTSQIYSESIKQIDNLLLDSNFKLIFQHKFPQISSNDIEQIFKDQQILKLKNCNIFLEIKILNYQLFSHLMRLIDSFQTWKSFYESVFNKKVSWLAFRNYQNLRVVIQILVASLYRKLQLRHQIVKDQKSLNRALELNKLCMILTSQPVQSRNLLSVFLQQYCNQYQNKRLCQPYFLVQIITELYKMGCLQDSFKKMGRLWSRITSKLPIITVIDAFISQDYRNKFNELLQLVYKYEQNDTSLCNEKIQQQQKILTQKIQERIKNLKNRTIDFNDRAYLKMFTEFVRLVGLQEYKHLLDQQQLICTQPKYNEITVSYYIELYDYKTKMVKIQEEFPQWKQDLQQIIKNNHHKLLLRKYKRLSQNQQNQALKSIKQKIQSDIIKIMNQLGYPQFNTQFYNNCQASDLTYSKIIDDIKQSQKLIYKDFQTRIQSTPNERQLQQLVVDFVSNSYHKMCLNNKDLYLIQLINTLFHKKMIDLVDLCLQITLNRLFFLIMGFYQTKAMAISFIFTSGRINIDWIQQGKQNMDLFFMQNCIKILKSYAKLYQKHTQLSNLYVRMTDLINIDELNQTWQNLLKIMQKQQQQRQPEAQKLHKNIEQIFNIKQAIYQERQKLGLNQLIRKLGKH